MFTHIPYPSPLGLVPDGRSEFTYLHLPCASGERVAAIHRQRKKLGCTHTSERKRVTRFTQLPMLLYLVMAWAGDTS